MPTKSDNATAVPAPAKEYDHEIVDMAKYVHHYNIDSDVAVSYTTPILTHLKAN